MINSSTAQTLLDSVWPNAHLDILDANFALLKREWVFGEFAAALASNLKALHLDKWRKDVFDCDKFSFAARVMMSVLHAEHCTMEVGAAFGIVNYKPDWANGGGHSINFGIFRSQYNPNAFVVRCFEPQTGKEFIFSAAENASVWEVIL